MGDDNKLLFWLNGKSLKYIPFMAYEIHNLFIIKDGITKDHIEDHGTLPT